MLKKTVMLILFFVFLVVSYFAYTKEPTIVRLYPNNNATIQNLTTDKSVKFREIQGKNSKKYYEIRKRTWAFYRKTDLKLKADSNCKLNVVLMAPGYHNSGKEVYVYTGNIKFKDIKIKINNNDIITDKKIIVPAKKPKVYKVTINQGDNINITYKSKVHLLQIDLNNYIKDIALFIALIGLMFIPYSNRNDLWAKIKEKIQNIDPLYIKTFWMILGTLFIVFSINIITMFRGNHDWWWIYHARPINTDTWMGRYGANLIKNILLDGQYIPILTYLAAFTGFAAGAVALNIFWEVPKKLYMYVICGLLLTIQPFTLEWTYYIQGQPEIYIAPFAIILGFILAEKSLEYMRRTSILQFISINILSILLFNWALSVYPSFINTLVIVLLGKLFIKSLDWDGETNSIKSFVSKSIPAAVDILIAGVIFKIVLMILKITGILRDFYTINPISLHDLPGRIMDCIEIAFTQLYSYQHPFIPNHLCEMFTLLLIMLVVLLAFKLNSNIKSKNLIVKCLQFGLLFFAIIGTKTATMICADPQFLVPRIDLFGLVYFRVLIVAALFILINKEVVYKNMVLLITTVILFTSAVNDLWAQKVWSFGLETEKMLFNRIIMRIESNPNFNSKKAYHYIQIGANNSARCKYYTTGLKTIHSVGLLLHPFDHSATPFVANEFYYPGNFIKTRNTSTIPYTLFKSLKRNYNGYAARLNNLYDSGVLQNMKAWPAEESIYIKGDLIVLVTDEKELHRVITDIKNGKLKPEK